MTYFQFLGAFTAVVASSGPGTSFVPYGQCDAEYGTGSRYMSADTMDEPDFDAK